MIERNTLEPIACHSKSRAAYAIVVACCLVGLVACRGGARLFDALVSNCEVARAYLQLSHAIQSPEDIDQAFRKTGLERPAAVKTVLDAKVFFARASIEEGCEWGTHAGVFLGRLLLQRGQPRAAIHCLEKSVKNSPTSDGYQLLALAYEAIGEQKRANAARGRAESLKGLWDK